MAPRITTKKYDKAIRLLDEGKLSLEEIAEGVGISKGSLSCIISGKRRRSLKPKPKPKPMGSCLNKGPKRRCSSCGHLVYGKCSACDIRKRMIDGTLSRMDLDENVPDTGLVLSGDIEERYQKHRRDKDEDDEVLGPSANYEREAVLFGDGGGTSVRDTVISVLPWISEGLIMGDYDE